MRILATANVVKIGAQSLIDRGRSAVFPVVEELGACAAKHQLIVGVGAGTRVVGLAPVHLVGAAPSVGRMPEYRTDSGMWLIAEAFGRGR